MAQMSQLPIVALQRTKIVRSRKLFNVCTSMDQPRDYADDANEARMYFSGSR